MVENAVQNDFHSTFVGLLHEMGQKLVAGFQIFRIRHTLNVFGRMGIIIIPGGQALPAVVNDLPGDAGLRNHSPEYHTYDWRAIQKWG